jgi:8-oxo-dGTP pyrophosphatase MutT (NUDIX family)
MNQTYSAGGIIINDRKQVLLINEGDGFWGLPKGRIENNEDALVAAMREIKEETGLSDIVFIKELGSYQRHPVISDVEDQSELKNITLFQFRTSQTIPMSNEENNECAWFLLEDAANKISHSKDKEFFMDAMTHPLRRD